MTVRAYEIVTCDICRNEVPPDQAKWEFLVFCEGPRSETRVHVCRACYDETLPDDQASKCVSVFRALWARMWGHFLGYGR